MEEESLAEEFRAIGRSLRRMSLASLATWDVTPSQARALQVLTRHGTLRLSELSAHLRIAPRSGTEVVDDLESKGLLQRRPDPQDRRATLISVTDKGEAVAEEIRAARAAEAERLFGRLTRTERDELRRLLRTLRD